MIDDPKTLRWYLAGPMSRLPYYNVPAFDRIADALRGSGYSVVSPAELDGDHVRNIALNDPTGTADTGATWGDFLSRDVKIVADEVDGIILMPGWEKSKGARLEAYVALQSGKSFMTVDEYNGELFMSQVSDDYVRTHVRAGV